MDELTDGQIYVFGDERFEYAVWQPLEHTETGEKIRRYAGALYALDYPDPDHTPLAFIVGLNGEVIVADDLDDMPIGSIDDCVPED